MASRYCLWDTVFWDILGPPIAGRDPEVLPMGHGTAPSHHRNLGFAVQQAVQQ